MIVVAVADDQPVELCRIDADQLHVVEQHLGRVAVVEHQRALVSRGLGFQPQRQPPLVVQRFPEIGAARWGRDRYAVGLLGPEEHIVTAVDQDTDRELVDRRHLDRRGARDLDA